MTAKKNQAGPHQQPGHDARCIGLRNVPGYDPQSFQQPLQKHESSLNQRSRDVDGAAGVAEVLQPFTSMADAKESDAKAVAEPAELLR